MSNTLVKSSYSLNLSRDCACRLCGKTFRDTASIDLSEATPLADLPALIDGIFNQHIPNIPVGWSCNGRDKRGIVIVHCSNH